MSLTPEERGELEKAIDEAINILPTTLPLLRKEDSPLGKHVKHKEDFVLGQMIGWAFGIMSEIMTRNGKSPTPERLNEITEAVLNRIPQLKEAIFKQG